MTNRFAIFSRSEFADGPEYDRSVVGGLVISFVLVAFGILITGRITNYFDCMGLLIVLGGTFGATLVNFSYRDMQQAWWALQAILRQRELNPSQRIKHLIELAGVVRREGFSALEREARRVDDPFLAKALAVVVDTHDAEEIRRLLETETRAFLDSQRRAVQVFEAMAAYAPALGLIGTLIGLVQLLNGLATPETIGPAMSVALMTTLYGAVLANLVCIPVAGKLRLRIDEDVLQRTLIIEGAACLARQEYPVVVRQRLESFLPPVVQPMAAAGGF